MSKTGSPTAYAKHRKVAQQTVSKAIKSGRLKECLTRKGKRFVIDFEIADREWVRNSQPWVTVEARNTPEGVVYEVPEDGEESDEKWDFNKARTETETYKAKAAKLDYEVKKGSLVDAKEAAKTVFDILRVVRDRMLALPPNVTSSVLSAPDEASAILAVKREFTQILTEASQAVEQKFASS